MAREDRLTRRHDLNVILPGVQSVVVATLFYLPGTDWQPLPADNAAPAGKTNLSKTQQQHSSSTLPIRWMACPTCCPPHPATVPCSTEMETPTIQGTGNSCRRREQLRVGRGLSPHAGGQATRARPVAAYPLRRQRRVVRRCEYASEPMRSR
jgi:hypothetical protein